jgi:hypothetical protein
MASIGTITVKCRFEICEACEHLLVDKHGLITDKAHAVGEEN